MSKVTLEWETPNLSERILLLGIEQSRAVQQQQLQKAQQLSESMLDELRRAIYEEDEL